MYIKSGTHYLNPEQIAFFVYDNGVLTIHFPAHKVEVFGEDAEDIFKSLVGAPNDGPGVTQNGNGEIVYDLRGRM